eukprot:4042502-Pyramimonas_sp.AAC.1
MFAAAGARGEGAAGQPQRRRGDGGGGAGTLRTIQPPGEAPLPTPCNTPRGATREFVARIDDVGASTVGGRVY